MLYMSFLGLVLDNRYTNELLPDMLIASDDD